jgi:23S rRNA (guanine1835-N2)-methyltransferase
VDRLQVPQGAFALERHPPAGRRPLRAWDAADEYLLHELAELGPADRPGTLVVNDAFGALTVALSCGSAPSAGPVDVLTDSHVSVLATRQNLDRNGAEHVALRVHAGADALDAGGTLEVGRVLVKVPKSLALLEDQLRRVRAAVPPGTEVLGAAMARHLPRAAVEVFERVLGPTEVSLARKKARVLRARVDPTRDPGPLSWPREHRAPSGDVVVDHPGVHAAGRLDPGTAQLLEHLDVLEVGAGETVVDLGCGDGIVGLEVARRQPEAEVLLVDESHLAVASAELTIARNLGADHRARVVLADVLEVEPGQPVVEPGSVDAVLVNPPFHLDRAVGDDTAWRMFTQAHRALRPGGQILVVGNRHLAHHAKLSRLFGSSEVLSKDPRFVVCRAVRR